MSWIRKRQVRQRRLRYPELALLRKEKRRLDAKKNSMKFLCLMDLFATETKRFRDRVEKEVKNAAREQRRYIRKGYPVRLNYLMQLDEGVSSPRQGVWIGSRLFTLVNQYQSPLDSENDDHRELHLMIMAPPVRAGRIGLRERAGDALDYWLSTPQKNFGNQSAFSLIRSTGLDGLQRVADQLDDMDFARLELVCEGRHLKCR
jgi:hypothetical protein